MSVRSTSSSDGQGPDQTSAARACLRLKGRVSDSVILDLLKGSLAQGSEGVVPQVSLDPQASTMPMLINPASLWTDGDTTPDLPEHWRPITINFAASPIAPPVTSPPP